MKPETQTANQERPTALPPATGSAAATAEVVTWAQAVLTALNVGDVQSGSKLHLKLREVMIAYRAATEIKTCDNCGKQITGNWNICRECFEAIEQQNAEVSDPGGPARPPRQ